MTLAMEEVSRGHTAEMHFDHRAHYQDLHISSTNQYNLLLHSEYQVINTFVTFYFFIVV